MKTCIRAVIVDAQLLFLEALRVVVQADDRVRVVGHATDAESAVRVVTECRPDLVLLDFSLPPASGLDVLRELAATNLGARALMVTSSATDVEILQALELGGCGVVLKQSAVDVLQRAIHAVMSGQYWLERDRVGRIVQEMRNPETGMPRGRDGLPLRFTRRQLQIMSAIVSGGTNDDIARRLSIRPSTVKYHLAQLFDKTGATNRVALARMVGIRGLHAAEQNRRGA
jgi:DNA-binding NarL/FixJ family response regulator